MAENQGLTPEAFRPRSLHVVAGEDLELLDLSSAEAFASTGLAAADIASDD